jgi:ABC-2 type transport system ATP-binding protein
VLQAFCRGGRTILFSTHMLSDIQRLADSVGIIHEGRLLVHCGVADLLSQTKRIRLALEQDESPSGLPDGVIRTWRNRRECVLTVAGWDAEQFQRLDESPQMHVVEVMDVGLEDIFKDYIKGQREAI